MADRTMLSFEVDEQLGAFIADRVEAGGYDNVAEYVRDLIRHDDGEPDVSEASLAFLRAAFAAPSADCVYVTAQDVIDRGRARRSA